MAGYARIAAGLAGRTPAWDRFARWPVLSARLALFDEQAAQILSVGQAVDFVLAHAPSAS